jgi:hypothetical protein
MGVHSSGSGALDALEVEFRHLPARRQMQSVLVMLCDLGS